MEKIKVDFDRTNKIIDEIIKDWKYQLHTDYRGYDEDHVNFERWLRLVIIDQIQKSREESREEERERIQSGFHDCCLSHNGNPTALQLAACTQLVFQKLDHSELDQEVSK